MERMKTTRAKGGSHSGQAERAIYSYSTSRQSNDNKSNLDLEKLAKVFNRIGYFIPVILSTEQWINIIPNDIKKAPLLKVYIVSDCCSFYMLDALTGELAFYSNNGNSPDYSNDSIFNKLDGELL